MNNEPNNELVNYRLTQIEITLEKIWKTLDNDDLETRIVTLETQLRTLRAIFAWLFPGGIVASAVVSWLLR